MSTAMVRSAILHVASAAAGGVAVISFAASHSVDLYAVYDQLNVVVADIAKLVGLVTPLFTGAYAVYKATTKQKLSDIAADPKAPEVARLMPVTPESAAVAKAILTPP